MNGLSLNPSRLDPHFIYGADAAVSLAMGVVLMSFAETLTGLAGWMLSSSFLWTIGLLLLPWAAFNFAIARIARPSAGLVRGNLAGDGSWIVGTVALIAWQLPNLTPLGLVLLCTQGLAVAVVLMVKLAGARKLA